MKGIPAGVLIILTSLFFGCVASRRITHWKNAGTYNNNHNKIMVVGIVKDTLLRRQMEQHFAGDLQNLGYMSASAVNEFGFTGLSKLSQEETYTKLCDNGIDAVITIVLIDEQKQKSQKRQRFKTNLNSFYYQRMWNYVNIQADQTELGRHPSRHHSFWETVFFDLRTLQPLYAARTSFFTFSSADSMAHEYGTALVKDMLKHKILVKQNITRNVAYSYQPTAIRKNRPHDDYPIVLHNKQRNQ